MPAFCVLAVKGVAGVVDEGWFWGGKMRYGSSCRVRSVVEGWLRVIKEAPRKRNSSAVLIVS